MTSSILRRSVVAALSAVSLAAVATPLAAQAIRNDPGFATIVTPANDDNQFAFTLPFSVTWDGLTTSSLYVNNNGYISVGESPSGSIRPCGGGPDGFATSCSERVFMAMNSDLDSRGAGTSPLTFGMGMVDGHQAFGANWFNFGYYSFGAPVLNFQLVLIDRSDLNPGDFAVEFNYGQMPGGIGGRSGWAAPSGYGINTDYLNADPTNGRSQFTVTGGAASGITAVDPTASTVAPEPSTYVLMGSGLLGLAGVARRRRRSA